MGFHVTGQSQGLTIILSDLPPATDLTLSPMSMSNKVDSSLIFLLASQKVVSWQQSGSMFQLQLGIFEFS